MSNKPKNFDMIASIRKPNGVVESYIVEVSGWVTMRDLSTHVKHALSKRKELNGAYTLIGIKHVLPQGEMIHG